MSMNEKWTSETEIDSILFYILVPVYNVEHYIDDCIRSVLNQTYQKFRLVLVDDGSLDLSGKICDEYAKKDRRIWVIHQENQGLLAARTAARQYVTEQEDWKFSYIVYLDSDDSLKCNALEIINQMIVTQACDMVVYGMDRVMDGKVIQKFDSEHSFIGTISDKGMLYKIVFGSAQYNPLWRKAISAWLLSEEDYSRLYYICHAEDLLQSIPYYENCHKVCFIQDALYNYTLNPNSITQSVSYENYRIDSTVRKTVWDFLESQNVWVKKDYDEYLTYLRKNLTNEVKTISRFDISTENTYRLYDEINADVYYQLVLQSRKCTDWTLNCLASGQYIRLNKALKAKNWLREIYHKMKRFIRGGI